MLIVLSRPASRRLAPARRACGQAQAPAHRPAGVERPRTVAPVADAVAVGVVAAVVAPVVAASVAGPDGAGGQRRLFGAGGCGLLVGRAAAMGRHGPRGG